MSPLTLVQQLSGAFQMPQFWGTPRYYSLRDRALSAILCGRFLSWLLRFSDFCQFSFFAVCAVRFLAGRARQGALSPRATRFCSTRDSVNRGGGAPRREL